MPVVLLRGWLDDDGTLSAVRRSGSYIVTAPQAVAHEINLYRAGVEINGFDLGPEEAFAAIEGAGAAALRLALEDEAFDDSDRYDLSLLIALQFFRARGAMRLLVPSELGMFVEDIAQALDAVPPDDIIDYEGGGIEAGDAARLLRDGLPEFVGFQRAFRFQDVLGMTHRLAAMVYRREWTVARYRFPLVLIGDDPVGEMPLGIAPVRRGPRQIQCPSFVPLDATTLLCVENEPRRDRPEPQFERDPSECVDTSNRFQCHWRDHFLFAHNECVDLAVAMTEDPEPGDGASDSS